MRKIVMLCVACAGFILVGCKDEKKQSDESAQGTNSTASPTTKATGGDHPNAILLGTKTVGGLELKAMQDEPVKAGSEGAFDLVIKGGKPKAVRFWVGVESGAGSVKAKAEEETPDNWHTHAEVPNPLPPESKFWAEIEPQTGEKFNVSFDLKM